MTALVQDDALVVIAPAKINLFLGVGPLRADGYHELATIFQALSLHDTLTVAPAARLTLTIEGAAGLPTGKDNLVMRAARLLKDRFGVRHGMDMVLNKKIPVAGGMAGGSSNAAAALVAANALWNLGLSAAELSAIGAELGSDVPFCLLGGTALGLSRGEELSPVLSTGSFHWVIATSDAELSTPAVYQRCDELRAARKVPDPQVPRELMWALRSGDPERVGEQVHNDLQLAAIAMLPELDLLLETGRDYGALAAMVSGSGPTCVFLARDEEHALDLTVALSGTGLCKSAFPARGPASGAQIA